ncbi:ABC transporter permease [Cryobacterium psychrophilum]|uniref:ABC transporter permease n=2 Tax=Cryobacterium psychrophilum TaxID=41988 RepID=A0A4Y8KPD5_9MICO|nr:ABC transporter permease [Cryobacterium psychrophilum]
MWWILLLVLFGYIAMLAVGLAALFGGISSGAIPADVANTSGMGVPGLTALPTLVYGLGAAVGYVFPILIGTLATTSEVRHQTLTPTFLANPRRGSVLAAKAIALFVMGVGYGVVAVLASVGTGALTLAAFGVDTQLGEADTWALVGRLVLAMALWAIVGVGLGVLVPSQVAAIVIVLAFTQFVEPLLRLATSFIDWTATVGQFLPGAASDALVGSSFYSMMSPTGSVVMLDWWQGGLVLLAYAIAFTVVGYFVSWKRDVT